MQPSLIKLKKPIEKKIRAWIGGIEKTGVLRSSAIPDLEGIEKYIDIKNHKRVLVESIEFNTNIDKNKFFQLIDTGLLELDKTLASLDFLNQKVDHTLIEAILNWLAENKSSIRHCDLGSLAESKKAWRSFTDLVLKHGIGIQSLELGKTQMNLSRAKDVVNFVQDPSIALSRLGLGESKWSFCEMKAFLWMGGFSQSQNLTRLSLSDATLCANSRRLLLEHMAKKESKIRVFSSGIVEFSDGELIGLFEHMQTRESNLLSVVLSNQTLSKKGSEYLAKVIGQSETLRHLAVINCWFDREILEEKMLKGKVPNIYIEAITAGQIQTMAEIFTTKGYEIEREVSRHRIKLKLPN